MCAQTTDVLFTTVLCNATTLVDFFQIKVSAECDAVLNLLQLICVCHDNVASSWHNAGSGLITVAWLPTRGDTAYVKFSEWLLFEMPCDAIAASFSTEPLRLSEPSIAGRSPPFAPDSKQPSYWHPHPIGHGASNEYKLLSQYCNIAPEIAQDEEQFNMEVEDAISKAERIEHVRLSKKDRLEKQLSACTHESIMLTADYERAAKKLQQDADLEMFCIIRWLHAEGRHGGGTIPKQLIPHDDEGLRCSEFTVFKWEDLPERMEDLAPQDIVVNLMGDANYMYECDVYAVNSCDPTQRRAVANRRQRNSAAARGELYTNLMHTGIKSTDDKSVWAKQTAVILWASVSVLLS